MVKQCLSRRNHQLVGKIKWGNEADPKRQNPQAQVQSPLQDLAVFPGPVSAENYLGPLYAWKPEDSRYDLKAEV